MKIRYDVILLCILWILALMLGGCFWFNTAYGFNIFSGAHWQYLAQIQATHTTIRSGFYISMIIWIIIAITGMYWLIRPRLRKINLPRIRAKQRMLRRAQKQQKNTPTTNEQSAPPHTPTQTKTTALIRPPRLSMPIARRDENSITAVPTTTIATPTAQRAPTVKQEQIAIQQIFERAGYVIKPTPKYIRDLQPALLAIGLNESLWLGAIGAPLSQMHNAINNLNQIFANVLEDVEININAFVIATPDTDTSKYADILTFNSISDLDEYMSLHPNPPVSDDDRDNFDAYSTFITTVVEYIGKM